MISNLDSALEQIFSSEMSGFYRGLWKELPRRLTDARIISSEHFIETDLYSRLYRNEAGLVKVITDSKKRAFLTKRAWTDMAKDRLSITGSERPLVLIEGGDEGLEFSLISYEHNALPYIGDINNLEVTLFCANQFKVTTLLCDTRALCRLFEAGLIPPSIESIIVVDNQFKKIPKEIRQTYEVRTYLSLPESGVLGEVTADGVIQSAPGILLESVDDTCVITKPDLITPLIRYRTAIPCAFAGQDLMLLDHSSS